MEPTRRVAPQSLGTSLARARFLRPSQVERMQQTLSRQGQLTPLVVVEQTATLEIVDGFKRKAAAQAMEWPELLVRVAALDSTAQWAAMLQLNRGPQSVTVLEEALILRELRDLGQTQVEIGQLLGRHKSWVSRRLGLVERLHPELVESMRLGLLEAGVARRLLGLPPGNQLELASVAQQATLGPRDTERLVSLWQKAPPEIRRHLLLHPREALDRAFPKPGPPPADPRLTPHGQKLRQMLARLAETTPRTMALLRPPPAPEDLALLSPELRAAHSWLSSLCRALGPYASAPSTDASAASGATP